MCVFLKTLPSTAYCSVFKHLLFYPNIFHIGFESSELVVTVADPSCLEPDVSLFHLRKWTWGWRQKVGLKLTHSSDGRANEQ